MSTCVCHSDSPSTPHNVCKQACTSGYFASCRQCSKSCWCKVHPCCLTAHPLSSAAFSARSSAQPQCARTHKTNKTHWSFNKCLSFTTLLTHQLWQHTPVSRYGMDLHFLLCHSHIWSVHRLLQHIATQPNRKVVATLWTIPHSPNTSKAWY